MDEYTKKSIDRMAKSRNFPYNTCPASRHVEIAALAFAEQDEKHIDIMTEEPEHLGDSMLSVLTSLYEARAFLESLGYTWKCDENEKNRWVKK
jgi:hypothetical protein